MGTVNVNLGEASKLNLILGQQLENAVTSVVFDFSAWQTAYGSGTLGLSVQRPGDDQPYAVVMTVAGTNATWSITSLDTAYKGVGEIQVTYTVGTVVKKSVVYKFTVYKSLGENGEYPSPGQTWQEEIEEEIADVKQDLSGEVLRENIFTGFKQGYYAGSNGAYDANHNNYVCTVSPIPLKYSEMIYWNLSELTNIAGIYINAYDSDMNYIASFSYTRTHANVVNGFSPSVLAYATYGNIAYANFSLYSSGGSSITPSTVVPLRIFKSYLGTGEQLENAIKNNVPYMLNWTNMIYDVSAGYPKWYSTRIGVVDVLKIEEDSFISVASGYKYNVSFFSAPTASNTYYINNPGWTTAQMALPKGSYITITLAKSDDASILPTLEIVSAITIRPNYYVKPLSMSNYALGSDFQKSLVDISYLGNIQHGQSFCKYNGKYYSISGSYIAVQNSSFTVEQNIQLNTGHGNSFQLGESKYAYASGWDDQKIYKVDLDNLTIADTITLPTTGYTTGVVDEVRNYAYVFQRDTLPDTEDNYNFIVYDITNQQILSTKKILSFGAMQACDLYHDRIIVANGLGNSGCPNGYRIFDTSGNILGEYILGDMATQEPEGICIDRDSHELLINYFDNKLYKIS